HPRQSKVIAKGKTKNHLPAMRTAISTSHRSIRQVRNIITKNTKKKTPLIFNTPIKKTNSQSIMTNKL
ncbi:hypothetical protein Q6254_27630, partial [Klebsiella pneumoniae]|uniref:hypothetical protein n=1 Tax=Klebsiella pneumoniae TaxID=573 RepID=UPI0027301144